MVSVGDLFTQLIRKPTDSQNGELQESEGNHPSTLMSLESAEHFINCAVKKYQCPGRIKRRNGASPHLPAYEFLFSSPRLACPVFLLSEFLPAPTGSTSVRSSRVRTPTPTGGRDLLFSCNTQVHPILFPFLGYSDSLVWGATGAGVSSNLCIISPYVLQNTPAPSDSLGMMGRMVRRGGFSRSSCFPPFPHASDSREFIQQGVGAGKSRGSLTGFVLLVSPRDSAGRCLNG
jgi:hypothetical protein